MLCAISLIFIASIISSLEADTITEVQAIFYSIYGLVIFYHTSKPYWSENNKKKRRRIT